jgi:class 3 adenylate cyclase
MDDKLRGRSLTLEEIIALADRVDADLKSLRQSVELVVMFVDLAGSTAFKEANPSEEIWLPRLAIFLRSVSRIAVQHGEIVKYIGDEVMATFAGRSALLHAEQAAEEIIMFCKQFDRYRFEAKVGLDYGKVALVSLESGSAEGASVRSVDDPQGLVVDRCARIIAKAGPGMVLCSRAFHRARGSVRRWRRRGSFKAKGIEKAVEVFQLEIPGCEPLKIEGDGLDLSTCVKRVRELEEVIAAMKELR